MPDEDLVFAIDLRPSAMDEASRELREECETAHELPETPTHPIRAVALIIDDEHVPLLLPIEPTRDIRLLDALARLIRYSRLLGISLSEVAARYGSSYERELVSSGRLPEWAFRREW